jgi:hypothetical protein
MGKAITTGLKTIGTPFLDAQLINISCLGRMDQITVLEILRHIREYNFEIELYWENHKKTFDGPISELNRDILRGNIQKGLKSSGLIAKKIVDLCSKLIS